MFKYILILFGLFAFFGSCTDPFQTDGECGSGKFNETYGKYELAERVYLTELKYPYYDSVIYYKVSNGKAQFYSAKSKFNVCPQKHVGIQFQVHFTNVDQPLPIKVKGEVYWSIFGDEFTIVDGIVFPQQIFTTQFYDIGLKQAFGENEADFDVLLYIEFDDQGDYNKNLAYFTKHIFSFYIVIHGDNFVAPAQ